MDSPDRGYLSFSTFKTPSPHQSFNEQFSPDGSPQVHSSPIRNYRNFYRCRRYDLHHPLREKKGNQSNTGENRKSQGDKKKPNQSQNRSATKNDSVEADISKYYHPLMIQDPWKHLQQNSFKSNPIQDKDCEKTTAETTVTRNDDEPSCKEPVNDGNSA